MAKKINFKGTSETVKNAVKNFYDGYVLLANAQATYRQKKKNLDAKYATDEKAAKDNMTSAKSDSAKEILAVEYNNLVTERGAKLKELLDNRKASEKEARALWKPAYDLVIPFDEDDKQCTKKSEEYGALYKAYVWYQKTNDFSRFSELFSQFLSNIGYEKIANDPKYCETTALVFKTRLGSLAARSKDLLEGKTVVELSSNQFNKLFLMIFYQILKDNGVIETETTEEKAE